MKEHGSIVQSGVKCVAIYDNPNGDSVIRQEPPDFQDEDVYIVISKNNIDAVIAEMWALQALMGPAVKAHMTAAERQRKRRARRTVTRDVTPCHADPVTDRDTNGAFDVV
jgi:hypothetical protein